MSSRVSRKPACTVISLFILGYQKLSTNMKPWYVSTNLLVLGYPLARISQISSYLGISHLFLLNFNLSRDIPPVFV